MGKPAGGYWGGGRLFWLGVAMLSFWSLKGGWMPTGLVVSSFQRQMRAPTDLTHKKRYVSGGLEVLVSSRGGCTGIPETAFGNPRMSPQGPSFRGRIKQ